MQNGFTTVELWHRLLDARITALEIRVGLIQGVSLRTLSRRLKAWSPEQLGELAEELRKKTVIGTICSAAIQDRRVCGESFSRACRAEGMEPRALARSIRNNRGALTTAFELREEVAIMRKQG